jgi:hypothetical protein
MESFVIKLRSRNDSGTVEITFILQSAIFSVFVDMLLKQKKNQFLILFQKKCLNKPLKNYSNQLLTKYLHQQWQKITMNFWFIYKILICKKNFRENQLIIRCSIIFFTKKWRRWMTKSFTKWARLIFNFHVWRMSTRKWKNKSNFSSFWLKLFKRSLLQN